MKKHLLLIVMTFTAVFCYTQNVTVFVLSPPEKEIQDVEKISIMNFKGEKGKLLADYMTSFLLQDDRGIRDLSGNLFSKGTKGQTYLKGARTNVFSLVERNEIDKVLQEQNLSNSGLIDDTQAAEIGKILGIDAIITGSVSYTHKDEDTKKEGRDSKGNYWVKYCKKRIVTAEARMKIISTSTGEILGTTDSKVSKYESACNDERSGISSPSQIATKCVNDIAYYLCNYFNPYFKAMKYDFPKIKEKEYKSQGKEAKKFLQDYNFKQAYSIFKGIYDVDPYNTSTLVSLAYINDIYGNYDKSLEYAEILYELDPNDFKDAYNWVQREVEMRDKLAKLGVMIEEQELVQDENALADKVKTKGSRSDRYEVKDKPSKGAKTVSKVPGDLEFVILKEEGDWFLIQLIGGKEGYIHNDDVKR